MRTLSLIAAVALGGCAATPRPLTLPPAYRSDFDTGDGLERQNQQCLSAELNRIVAENYDGTRDAPYIPGEKLSGLAINKCIPDLGYQTSVVQKVVKEYVWQLASEIQSKALHAWSERQQKIDAARAAEDHARLASEEPAILAKYRTCIFTEAASLALVSEEPAAVVVSATYAACHSQREALLELHRRYGDPGFNDERMNRIEDRVAGTLVLTVMRARAAGRGSAPTQVPAAPPSPPAPGERAV